MSAGELSLDDIFIGLSDRILIASLTLTIAPGEVVTVMGPSGCGKSSLLAFICGTLDPAFAAAGHIRLGGMEISGLPPERRRIGILFQDDLLFPHMSVAENLAFGLPPGQERRRARRARIDAALSEAGLADFGDRDPATLSGGQRARIAVLRTLLSEPRALLLDEPFGRLDVRLRTRFRQTVFGYARSRRLPTLLVTHDPDDAASAGGRLIEVAVGDDAGAGTDAGADSLPSPFPFRGRR